MGDPKVLATALEWGLAAAADPERRRARRDLAAVYTWDANARKTHAAWEHVLVRAR
ncbi:MAG: hypothetical protein GY711_06310 [bacterium]|nr:hypothetical protein [bacterium]